MQRVILPKVGVQVTAGAALGGRDSYSSAFGTASPNMDEVPGLDAAMAAKRAHINAYPYLCDSMLDVRVKAPRAFEDMMSFDTYADLTRRGQRLNEWTKERSTR